MNGALPYLSCVVAACVLMLELRVVRHLTAETGRLDAVFRPDARDVEASEAEDV